MPVLGAWLHLAVLGNVVGLYALLWLAGEQRASGVLQGLLGPGDDRAELSARSTEISDSGASRLLRAALALQPEAEAGDREATDYRTAPGPSPLSPVLDRVRSAEARRILRGAAVGAGSAAIALASGALLVYIRWYVLGPLVGACAVLLAVGIARRARSALRELSEVSEALGRSEAARSAHAAFRGPTLREPLVFCDGGCMGAIFSPFCLVCLVGLGAQTPERLSANGAGVVLMGYVGLAAVMAPTLLGLAKIRIRTDAERAELVVDHRLFGVTRWRQVIPLESVRSFHLRKARWNKLLVRLEGRGEDLELATFSDRAVAEQWQSDLDRELGVPAPPKRAGRHRS